MEKDFLTVQEVAKSLKYTERTILDKIRDNQLSAEKVGGRWHINPLDFEEYQKGHPNSGKLGISRGDIELGPHQRSLFHFGCRLRDYLYIDMPYNVIEQGKKPFATTLWRGKETFTVSQNMKEEDVDTEWGYGNIDARKQSLFPYFRKHLQDNTCWNLLTIVEEMQVSYRLASEALFCDIRKELVKNLATEPESDIKDLAKSLLADAFYQVTGPRGLNFEYTPDKPMGGKGWGLQLGAWHVGNKASPQALKPIIAAHSFVSKNIYTWDSAKKLAKTWLGLKEAIDNFQHCLSPDDRLRKLITAGHCDLCP